jgi:hypothetical protein
MWAAGNHRPLSFSGHTKTPANGGMFYSIHIFVLKRTFVAAVTLRHSAQQELITPAFERCAVRQIVQRKAADSNRASQNKFLQFQHQRLVSGKRQFPSIEV